MDKKRKAAGETHTTPNRIPHFDDNPQTPICQVINNIEKAKEEFEKRFKGHNFGWRKTGRGYIAHCPFPEKHKHGDKHPSFSLYVDVKGIVRYRCFACGFSGACNSGLSEKIKALEEKEKLTKEEETKLKKLKEKLEQHERQKEEQKKAEEDLSFLKEQFLNSLKKDTVVKAYLQKRLGSIDAEKLQFFEIGYITPVQAKKIQTQSLQNVLQGVFKEKYQHILIFAYRNTQGNIASFKIRALDTEIREKGKLQREDKYIRTAKILSGPAIFNLKILHEHFAPFVFIVEGEFDVITTTLKSGFYIPIMGLGSRSNFTLESIQAIESFDKRPIVTLDWDQEGQKRLRELIEEKEIQRQAKKIWVTPNPPADVNVKDFDELFVNSNPAKAREILSQLEIVNLKEYIKQQWEQEKREKENELQDQLSLYPQNLQTVFLGQQETAVYLTVQQILDNEDTKEERLLGLFPSGSISILAGMGKAGKSYITLKMGIDIALQDKKAFLWFSEDTQRTIRKRILALFDFYDLSEQEKQKVLENVHIRVGVAGTPFFRRESYNYKVREENYKILQKIIEKHDFILLDPLLAFLGLSEKDDLIRDAIQHHIAELILNKQKTLVFTHHVTKISLEKIQTVREKLRKGKDIEIEEYEYLADAVRGSADIVNIARSIYFLISDPKAINSRILLRVRDNEAPPCIVDYYDVKLPFDFNNIAGNENVRKYRNQIPA